MLGMVKGQVESRLGPSPRSIRCYSHVLDEEFKKKWDFSDFSQLVRGAQSADVVLLGDFHAYFQCQRAHLRLLRELKADSLGVFCEFLRVEDQKYIDHFMQGRISESQFLHRVDWIKNWEFPWEHYRPLLLYFKEEQIPVFGIYGKTDSNRSLSSRDKAMAKRIVDVASKNTFSKTIVIVGEMHLASSHLPNELEKSIPFSNHKIVSVFQDVDSLYFKHIRNRPQVDSMVLQRGHRYCWFVSPPWVKWQSYLMFLEKTVDQDMGDDDELALEDHIKALVYWIVKDFGIKVDVNAIEVVTSEFPRKIKSSIPKEVLKGLIQADRSFLLDPKGKIYLSRTSVNHGAALSGQYIHAQLSHRRQTWFAMPDDLYGRLWIETVSFFFSKWINPQRKTEVYEDLRIRLESLSSKKRWRDTLNLVSELYLFGQKVKRSGDCTGVQIKKLKKSAKQSDAALEASRYLGRILGKNMFETVRAGKISKDDVITWLLKPLEDKDFEAFFWKVIVPSLI